MGQTHIHFACSIRVTILLRGRLELFGDIFHYGGAMALLFLDATSAIDIPLLDYFRSFMPMISITLRRQFHAGYGLPMGIFAEMRKFSSRRCFRFSLIWRGVSAARLSGNTTIRRQPRIIYQ